MTTRTHLTRVLGLLFVAALSLFTFNPTSRAASSLTQFGITWTFDRDYTTGQFANGDYWVVGPVKIINITPKSSTVSGITMHGTMINPAVNGSQGFDSRIKGTAFESAKNAARSFPISVAAGSSVVSVESYTTKASGDNPQLKTLAILTVLASPAPSGSFRPPPVGTNKTLSWNKSQLNYSKLRSLPRPSNTPSLSSVEAEFARPWYEARTNWTGRYLHADLNQPTYGRDLSHKLVDGLLSLQLDYTTAQKERLLIRLVQYGIDVYGTARAGGKWGADGGHNMGRKMPMLLAGAVLGDNNILSYANAANKFIFQEDQQTWYVVPLDVGRILYTADGRPRERYILSDVGIPEWGEKHFADPTRDGRNWTTYYRTVAGAATVGHVLTAQLMGLKSAWNWPATFDYYDRFFKIEGPNSTTASNYIQPFVKSMWTAYRGSTSTDYTPENTTTSGIWQTNGIGSQTGTFTLAFDMTPSKSPMDGITGLASGTPSQTSQLMAAVRFNSSGAIDALNGSTFAASSTAKYSAGVKYRVVMSVDVPKKTYSVKVTPSGGSTVTVASNWAFRSTSVSKLDTMGWVATSGSHAVTSIDVQTTTTTETTSGTSTSGSTSTGAVVLRVNAGGSGYTDSAGNRWAADYGFTGGLAATNKNTISGTTMQPLYRSERNTGNTWTPLKYEWSATNGDYVVKLHFAETWSTAFKNGVRVFDVRAEGKTVIDNLDIYAKAGANRALVMTVPVRVADGKLTLEFARVVQNPKICAIEVYKAQ